MNVNDRLRELYPDSEELFDIVLMTNNHAQVGVRLINSINHYGTVFASDWWWLRSPRAALLDRVFECKEIFKSCSFYQDVSPPAALLLCTFTDLTIERFCMTGGESPIGYLKAYMTNLYLSKDAAKVTEAIEEGELYVCTSRRRRFIGA